jgi:hypothetical protein
MAIDSHRITGREGHGERSIKLPVLVALVVLVVRAALPEPHLLNGNRFSSCPRENAPHRHPRRFSVHGLVDFARISGAYFGSGSLARPPSSTNSQAISLAGLVVLAFFEIRCGTRGASYQDCPTE